MGWKNKKISHKSFAEGKAALNEETCENEVAELHLNVPWAQQAEKKSLNVGCQKQTLQFMKIVILNFFWTHLSFDSCCIWGHLFGETRNGGGAWWSWEKVVLVRQMMAANVNKNMTHKLLISVKMVKTPDMTTLKKSKMLSNLPKWLVVTQIVLFGSQDLEIRSYVSSFSDQI